MIMLNILEGSNKITKMRKSQESLFNFKKIILPLQKEGI